MCSSSALCAPQCPAPNLHTEVEHYEATSPATSSLSHFNNTILKQSFVRHEHYNIFSSQLTYSLPTAAAIAAAYMFPAYSTTGLGLPQREETRNFGPYMGYTLLYLLTVQAVAMTSAWTFSTQQRAAAFLGLVVLVFCISGAYAVHPMDLSLVTSRLQWVSPLRWTLEQLAMVEFAGGTTPMYDCPRGPVVLLPECLFTLGAHGAAHALRRKCATRR
uniref:ABC transporter n=1 Tax=Rhipicephalus appendiculatus TaxID=34631 RepID=A0A131YUI9_RHIAP